MAGRKIAWQVACWPQHSPYLPSIAAPHQGPCFKLYASHRSNYTCMCDVRCTTWFHCWGLVPLGTG